jgi:hypothetical protein
MRCPPTSVCLGPVKAEQPVTGLLIKANIAGLSWRPIFLAVEHV